MKKSIKEISLHTFFIAGLILLVVGGPGSNVTRSIRDGWNLGHVPLFILFTFVLYQDWKGFKDKTLISQWVLVISFSVLLAVTTEVIQLFAGRQFDLLDIFRDLSGSVIGMLLLGKEGIDSRKTGNALKNIAITILVIITSYMFFLSLADEYIAARQFPVLASFETPLEINRWQADGKICISDNVRRSGNSSLKIEFTTKRYSAVTIRYSLGKWEECDSLRFSFFNPDTVNFKVSCRIHDNEHKEHNNAYSDRFNCYYVLENGWNIFAISLNDLRNAPSTREMNLNEIEQISFFSTSLPAARVVYLDDIVLFK